MDGTGNSWFYGDLAIKDGKISSVGNLISINAKKTIDAHGLIVAPGFIDVHTHIEDDEVKNPLATNFIYDGVTTVITGNCGASKLDLKKYFSFIDSIHLSINVASLIGHNDVREKVMGTANRTPGDSELHQMELLVDAAMREGAVGLSTGLIYVPGVYSKTPEIVALAKIAQRYNGVYTTHMRNEGDSVAQAIEEALKIGREAGIPVEISHFKVGGQQNWGRSTETLNLVKKARENGEDVTIDLYPYTASSTSLNSLLPEWILADGRDSMKARLLNPGIRKEVIVELVKNLEKRKLKHFSYAVVANYSANTAFNGKSIETINRELNKKHRAKQEAETILEMVENGGAGMVFHGMSEQDVTNIMQYPFCMFASDASIRVFNEGVPHPRGYGTNARVLGKYVREEKLFPLEEAIRRMTSLPAQKFHLNDRGLLLKGYAADIVIFDENKVKDLSTYNHPHQYSTGFEYVLVNGNITLENGKHTGTRKGQVLRRPNDF